MTRQVVEHTSVSRVHGKLTVITIYENGISKEQIKRMNQYTKKHDVLIHRNGLYEFKN